MRRRILVGVVGWAWALAPLAGREVQGGLDPARVKEGEAIFAKSCAIAYCHGKEGGPGRAPALRERTWEVRELRDTIRDGVPNSSMPNWDDKLTPLQIEAVVAYILAISGTPPAAKPKAADPPAAGPAAAIPDRVVGSPARGEELFFQTGERGCAGCHAIDGKGNAVGPDLTGSSRREARALLEDIVDPAARVAPEHARVRITMKDGEKISALRQEETDAALRVFDLAGIPPSLRRLRKDAIASIEPDRAPAMPARYGEILTLRQLLDLVSFLKSSGAAAPVRVSYRDVVR